MSGESTMKATVMRPFSGDQTGEARLGERSAGVSADQGVRRTGGQSEIPGEQIPHDCAQQAGEHHPGRHQMDIDEAAADGGGDAGSEQICREEVEYGGPDDGHSRPQDARRYYGRDGVGGVMKAVDVIEDQREANDADYENEGIHAGSVVLD